MAFPFHIDILSLIFKGILIGIIASAPMGPVGILCVQRTLNKGRWYGFITGIGASVSDIIYALITGLGMSFVMDLIKNPHNSYILQITASIILLLFGVYCFRSNPTKNMHISGNKKGTLIHNGVTAFLVTFSNPLIIFMFMGFTGILFGALLWWFGLTWGVDKVRGKFDNDGILLINKIIGALVIIFSLVVLVGTVFNIYTFHY